MHSIQGQVFQILNIPCRNFICAIKQLLLFIGTVLLLTTTYGQQFSFKINFVDVVGNKDSLILGYDANATDTINPTFGEMNIISNPYISGLDVRVSNIWWKENSLSFANQSPFQTKTKIVTDTICGMLTLPIEIGILTNHWPVTAQWDSSLFIDNCRNGSLFTSFTPLGWWDVGSPSNLGRVILQNENSATYTSQGNNNGPAYSYIHAGDTVPVFWLAFSDSLILYTSTDDISKATKKIKVVPNPLVTSSTLQLNTQLKDAEVVILDMLGKEMLRKKLTGDRMEIERGSLVSGVYVVRLRSGERQWVEKVMVE